MKPNVGFEPTTFRFQVDKFAVSILKLVRGKGIEPLTTGWKPVILPLNEPRIINTK